MYTGLPKFLGRLLYAYLHLLLGELMNSVGSHGSLSLTFMIKVIVCHFVSDSHEVMTALIVVLPLIVVVEISLQLHQAFPFLFVCFCPCDLLLASSMAESSHCFQICSRNSVRRLVFFTGL